MIIRMSALLRSISVPGLSSHGCGCAFRPHLPLFVGQIFPAGMFTFNEIPAFRGIRRSGPFHVLDLEHPVGKPAERATLQPAQESGNGVALVPCQAEAVTEFLYRDPMLLRVLFLHELLQQFRHPGIFSHGSFGSLV